jgi:hypothetical protein
VTSGGVGDVFEVFRRGSGLYQSEYAQDSAGQELFSMTGFKALFFGTR